ncbi:MAG: hypothetical protein OSB57_03570, partial [Planctomycetota bacterium]|nr:hypothetical protein [Planctomycetota bacterium]
MTPRPEDGGGAARALRVLGFIVAGCLLWLAASKVPWGDELALVGPGDGVSQESFQGDLVGDWRGPWALFHFNPGALGPDSPFRGSILEEVLMDGGPLFVNRHGLAAVDPSAPTALPTAVLLPGEVTLRPGMPTAFRRLEPGPIACAFGFVLLCVLIIVTRWWRLLSVTGCATPWLTCVRL